MAFLRMPGTMMQAHYDKIPQFEARTIIAMARAFGLSYADEETRLQLIAQAYPQPEPAAIPFVLRYEGRPVTPSGLKLALSERWGRGFQAD